jgi:hypothetical protein
MRKSFLLVGAALLMLSGATANAMPAGGFGFGFLHSDFPVGIFYGINEQTAFHVGVGFHKFDPVAGSGGRDMTIGAAGALVYDIWAGPNWGFGIAPAVAYATTSYEDQTIGTTTTSIDNSSQLWVMGNLQGHWDPVDAVSFWFSHGITVSTVSPSVGDSTTEFMTDGNNVTSFGFTVWLP